MRKLRIVTYPNKLLRKKCRKLATITPQRQNKIRQMLKLLYRSNGIGLAAPQVGWNAQVFVMNTTRDPKNELVFINPEILEEAGDLREELEGCLSFPGLIGAVDRKHKVTVKAQNIDGDIFEFADDALAGRCMLHEIDHLSGTLIIDKAKKLYKSKDNL